MTSVYATCILLAIVNALYAMDTFAITLNGSKVTCHVTIKNRPFIFKLGTIFSINIRCT